VPGWRATAVNTVQILNAIGSKGDERGFCTGREARHRCLARSRRPAAHPRQTGDCDLNTQTQDSHSTNVPSSLTKPDRFHSQQRPSYQPARCCALRIRRNRRRSRKRSPPSVIPEEWPHSTVSSPNLTRAPDTSRWEDVVESMEGGPRWIQSNERVIGLERVAILASTGRVVPHLIRAHRLQPIPETRQSIAATSLAKSIAGSRRDPGANPRASGQPARRSRRNRRTHSNLTTPSRG